MTTPIKHAGKPMRQAGLTLVEMLVSIAIAVTILSGVVQVLLASKNNFISERELSSLQENARFAMKQLSDEIRMAGYTGCLATPPHFTNTVTGSNVWHLNGLGLQGFDNSAGVSSFPTEFSGDVKASTDAIVVRRGETTGLRLTASTAATLPLNRAHAYQPAQLMLITDPSCVQVALFQISGPTNTAFTATTIEHAAGGTITPSNCTSSLTTDDPSFSCSAGVATTTAYTVGSAVLEMHSEAYYIGNSESDATVPALFRERLLVNTSSSSLVTVAEELVQGVDNMQIEYGYDTPNYPTVTFPLGDGLADQYLKANSASLTNWSQVVSVRLTLRMRSVYPIYDGNVAYGDFEGVSGTSGSDRFMRQTVSTTIQIRNF
jgi:type IV pilus assembly protein PilW